MAGFPGEKVNWKNARGLTFIDYFGGSPDDLEAARPLATPYHIAVFASNLGA